MVSRGGHLPVVGWTGCRPAVGRGHEVHGDERRRKNAHEPHRTSIAIALLLPSLLLSRGLFFFHRHTAALNCTAAADGHRPGTRFGAEEVQDAIRWPGCEHEGRE